MIDHAEPQDLYFGVFNKGSLLWRVGSPLRISINQAEIVATLLSKYYKAVLSGGDYFAYDFEPKG